MFRNNEKSMKAVWPVIALLMMAGCGQSQEPARPGEVPPVAALQQAVQAMVIEVKTSQVPVSVEVTGQVTAV